MAAQPSSPARGRRPTAARRLPESLGPRALRIGLRSTLLATLGAAAWVALVTDREPDLGARLPLFLALVAVGATVAFLPWDRLHGTSLGTWILRVWAILNIVLITIAGRVIGAEDSALPLAYAITFVFFVLVLSPGVQVVFLCFGLVCYGVAVSSSFEPLPFLLLTVLGVLAIFLSRELRRRIAAHDRARVDSERRWRVVGTVSSAAREAAVTEPRRVLQGIVEAIVALGYETAAIHLPREQGELQLVLPAAAEADVAAGIRTLPDTIRTRVLEEGRDTIVSVKELGRQAVPGLRSSGVETLGATQILVGERTEGVLIVGSADPEGITAAEVEAFAMLAATASMALGNARRAEERRQVEEHLTDADAVRAEVLSMVSKEVRKPLGAVTGASRALRETFGSEERHRLIERLVASATALDVTLGGSLDLSLLEVSRVELQSEEADVGELVSRVLTRLSALFEQRQLRAEVPTGLSVEVDAKLLDQAIEHLLVTAATSTPPGKTVEVSVSRAGAETIVKVASDAVIPAEQLARIREPLGQGNGGAGPWIRLALASRILELHGSELQTRSVPKQGTTVWFRLPGERSSEPGLSPTAPARAMETGPVQLTLDDAMLPAMAAAAARIEPPPVPIEEPERSSTPIAAAALAATVATSLAVTGIVPGLTRQPNTPAASSERRDEQKKKSDRNHDRKRSDDGDRTEAKADAGSSKGSTTVGTTSGGTTGGDGTTGGTDGGGSITPAPSPTPAPEDQSPGKSGEAPGHNKPPGK